MQVPVSQSSQPGTAFTEIATGFIFAPYKPSMLGGFIIFSLIAFTGMLLFFFAGRHWLAGWQLKMYGLAVLFAPSLIFWPSSIGKDALMVFFLGLAAYGASRLLKFYQFSSLFLIAPGIYLAMQIRSHVAAVMAISIALAAVFGKPPKKYEKSNPIQTGWAETPNRIRAIAPLSKSDRGRKAVKIPIGKAISSQMIVPPMMSDNVTGRDLTMMSLTYRGCLIE